MAEMASKGWVKSLLKKAKENNLLGGGDVYSTEETVIGTWIDGKPIYRKVVNIPDQATANTRTTLDVSDMNIDKVVNLHGYAQYHKTNIDSLMHIPFSFESDGIASFRYTQENNQIAFNCYQYHDCFINIVCIVEYTKITD